MKLLSKSYSKTFMISNVLWKVRAPWFKFPNNLIHVLRKHRVKANGAPGGSGNKFHKDEGIDVGKDAWDVKV